MNEPIAWLTEDGDRSITAAQKAGMIADGGAGASSVKPYCVPAYAAPTAEPSQVQREWLENVMAIADAYHVAGAARDHILPPAMRPKRDELLAALQAYPAQHPATGEPVAEDVYRAAFTALAMYGYIKEGKAEQALEIFRRAAPVPVEDAAQEIARLRTTLQYVADADPWKYPNGVDECLASVQGHARVALASSSPVVEDARTQEAVAWRFQDNGIASWLYSPRDPATWELPPEVVQPLYAAPVEPRTPLPDHQIVTMYAECPTCDTDMIEFAREIERAHGIGAALASPPPAQEPRK